MNYITLSSPTILSETMKIYYYVISVGAFIATLLTVTFTIRENLRATDKLGFVGPYNDSVAACDLFSGRWVYDNVSYPLYEESQCSLMIPEFACQRFGRQNLRYQHWAWKPHHCHLPRFDGGKLMDKIRGKRVVFVGDSLNRNQWASLLCLIESSLNRSLHNTVTRHGNFLVFHAIEYNATIEFYWSPLLVESNCDNPYNHSAQNEIMLRINSIEKHARHWTDADILIFDSFAWWVTYNMTLLWGAFGSPETIHKKVPSSPRLYEMCLGTWSNWLELNINRTKTKLFFMSLSPHHYKGEHHDGRGCYEETEPISKEDYWGVQNREMMRRVESVIERLEKRGVHVQYLNITHLSDYRKDAHRSIYKRYKKPITKEDLLANPLLPDCLHWCLPGVPDVWNIILYHYIMNK